jgi:hypothetical protein
MTPERLLVAAMTVTVLHIVAAGLGLIDSIATLTVSVVVNLSLFLVGSVVFVVAFFVAASRSRTEDVWFGGAFFLTGGVAPVAHRRVLFFCVAVQTVVGLGVAALRPFTASAFSVLVPILGMGMVALYGAQFGRFSEKTADG